MATLPYSLLSFLPEVNPKVAAGNVSVEDAHAAWSLVRETIDESAKAVLLHGSVAKGSTRPY
jgi:hypothetical protein